VWYTWTAPVAGSATFETQGDGSPVDTRLAVYTGASLNTLAPVASDDDSNGGSASRVTFAAEAGQTYVIAIDGEPTRLFTLAWSMPPVSPPLTDVRAGAAIANGRVPVMVRWSPTGGGDGSNTSYELQQEAGEGEWTDVALPAPAATSVSRVLAPGSGQQFQVRALESTLPSQWALGREFSVRVAQETNAAIQYAGSWRRTYMSSAYGRYVKHAAARGARARFAFSGDEAALVTTKGPNRGRVAVYVDGVLVKTIDLYAPALQPRRIVFARGFASAGAHKLEMRVLGSRNRRSTGTRVDVDAFVALQ
jgi:hypothetical protein